MHDCTYGFGPQFRVSDATMSEKTITYGGYDSHRRSHETFCPATKELVLEVARFMEAREKLHDWADKIKKQIREAAL